LPKSIGRREVKLKGCLGEEQKKVSLVPRGEWPSLYKLKKEVRDKMSKKLIVFLVILGLVAPAYAAVQNVKVSGDLTLQAISRNGFTLTKNPGKYKRSGLTSAVRLRVDADLIENVAVTIRLLNERSAGIEAESPTTTNIDLAYLTLKEMLYSPLTLIAGRQELRFGNALIIGDPDTNMGAATLAVPFDLSVRKAFDAMRVILNYDPVVVDLIYAKIGERDNWWVHNPAHIERRDGDLYGVNAKYDLTGAGIKGSAELYCFSRYDRATIDGAAGKKDTCHAVGTLLSGEIAENLTGSLEYAYQFGNAVIGSANFKRRAWALQSGINYTLPVDMSSSVGLVYTYLSGDKDPATGKFKHWNPMFEDQTPNAIPNALFPASNVQVINLKGSIKPTEDIILLAVYGNYRLAQKMSFLTGGPYGRYTMTTKKSLGNALDLTALYDYTEDVQLGLTFGLFDPGKAFSKANRKNATQLIGSMKVTF